MNQHDKEFVEHLLQYHHTGGSERSAYKDIPLNLLPYVRQYFKEQGNRVAVRYRGPRTDPLDLRPHSQRMQDCLKKFANRFSIYFI